MEENLRRVIQIQKALKDSVISKFDNLETPGLDPTTAYFDGRLVKGAIIFYEGPGCSWHRKTGGCFMCPYSTGIEKAGLTQEHVRKQIEYLRTMDELRELELVYLFPCSSFDDSEISFANQRLLLDVLSEFDNVKYVLFESRPEFIINEVLEDIVRIIPDKKVGVYMGLETTNDYIRKYCINKGYTFSFFKRKCDLLQEYGISACSFLLLKPPFLTEKEAVDDCLKTVKESAHLVENIILMGANTARFTIMQLLQEMGEYKPPWLWSVVEVLEHLEQEEREKIQLGGWFSRHSKEGIADYAQVEHTPSLYESPRNCGVCDPGVVQGLYDFNWTKKLTIPSCACRETWKRELDTPSPPLKERLPLLYEKLILYAASRREGQR